ncbi:MAG TPA: hypothetical protein VJJ46_04155 [Anaerolineales bacterium]|nr:hypothetical protein [Anaerolineales bacterium]
MPIPGDPAFDPEDPLDWIAAIEARWDNYDVIVCDEVEARPGCAPWTAEEAELLYETLGEHILLPYLDGELTMVRTDDDEHSGLFRPGVDETGARTGEVWIYDPAWRTSPAASLLDMFDYFFPRPEYFQGTIAHELTHAAGWLHPELLEAWVAAAATQGEHFQPGDWRLGWLCSWASIASTETTPNHTQS